MDNINLPKIVKTPEIVELLPEKLKPEDAQPRITYKLGPSIRNKIFNYKETVESIIVEENVCKSLKACECESSTFCDNDHGHVITGDLRIVKNSKLRKLFTKGPNYREPKSINFSKCLNSIKDSLENSISNLSEKLKIDKREFVSWKEKIISVVESKIEKFTKYKHPMRTNPILRNREVLHDLTELHDKYVIVPIDKAANNVAFICKTFYIKRLLTEVGIMGLPSETYKLSTSDSKQIVENNIKICENFGLEVNEKARKLPMMYWMPKLHKNPIGARFIIASSSCSTKPLSKSISNVFKLIFEQVKNFHLNSKFHSGLNLFWVIQNSKSVKEKLDVINTRKRAKCISTFDFSTLYTKIPHEDLLNTLNKIIDFVFSGGNNKYIGVNERKAFWCWKNVGKICFSKSSLKHAMRHLICESYFHIGNILLEQTIGIPMGIDPAPFWANLYLYKYEYDFMRYLMTTDIIRARKFHGCFRFIDDMNCLNDGNEFEKSYREIYPACLELKCEHKGTSAAFLDLHIEINDSLFIYKLYDKRDSFPFHIVRMPDRSSNIPSHIFYGTISSEFLRIARSTLLFKDFLPRAVNLSKRMLNQGGEQQKIFRQYTKTMSNYIDVFQKYDNTPKVINELIKERT